MKYAHILITVVAFGMLSAGWWVGKVDSATYVSMAAAAVGGTMWISQKNKGTTPTNPPAPSTTTTTVTSTPAVTTPSQTTPEPKV